MFYLVSASVAYTLVYGIKHTHVVYDASVLGSMEKRHTVQTPH